MVSIRIKKPNEQMVSGAYHTFNPSFNRALNEIGEAAVAGYDTIVIYAYEGQFAEMSLEKLALKLSHILDRPAVVYNNEIRLAI